MEWSEPLAGYWRLRRVLGLEAIGTGGVGAASAHQGRRPDGVPVDVHRPHCGQ